MKHTNTSRCVGYEPCPRCGSRDNVGIYDDGHKFCFGCHWYSAPTVSLATSVPGTWKQVVSSTDPLEVYESSSEQLSQKALEWIHKYDLNGYELEKCYGFRYHYLRDALVMPAGDGPIKCIQLKCFAGDRKYLTYGFKDNIEPYYTQSTNPDKRNILVCTEDILSAIKVHQAGFNSIPLLGTKMLAPAIHWASKPGRELCVWLDSDMVAESLRGRYNWIYGPVYVRSIISAKDPKCYTPQEISTRIFGVIS